MTRLIVFVCLLFLFKSGRAQKLNSSADSVKQKYLQELKIAGREFTKQFYPEYSKFYSLPESLFILKIDSVRNKFNAILSTHKPSLSELYVSEQALEIKYYFDKLLIEYPDNHNISLGKSLSVYTIPGRLEGNLADFNKAELLANSDFTNYVKAFLEFRVNKERKKKKYKNLDNQHLAIIWDLLPKFFSNEQCLDFWKYDYLFDHIENDGIKNLENFYTDFKATSKDVSRRNRIETMYKEDSLGRVNPLTKTYKTIGKYGLDMYMFLPDLLGN